METLGGFLARTTQQFGRQPALLWKPGYRTDVWSYRRLWEQSNQMAALLAARGVGRGDRVVIWAPNSPWWVAAYFGILLRGSVVVPLDLRCGADFVRRVIALTEPSLALLSASTRAAWEAPIPHVLVDAVDAQIPSGELIVDPGITPDDIAEIMFTSGTTGEPNGVILTHRNVRSNVDAVAQVIASSPRQRLLSILPLSHMFEQTIGLFLPLRGGASVFYPNSRQPTALFRDLNQQGVTTVLAVPQALQLFMSGIEREVQKGGNEESWRRLRLVAEPLPFWTRRLLFRHVHRRLGGRMRFFVSGGAPLDPALLLKWERLGIHVLQGYGATEAAPAIAGTTFRDRRPASVGKPLPGVEVALAPDGEVLVRGPNVTPGYWRNPEATRAVFRDGWYGTGDLGSLDRDGYLYLFGRKREMIVLASGQNVFPVDVERALTAQPGIVDAVVLGLPTDHGAEVHAVLLVDGRLVDAGTAVRQANSVLADHQKIRSQSVWLDADFPRTHTMKVKRADVLRVVLSRREPAPPSLGARYPLKGVLTGPSGGEFDPAERTADRAAGIGGGSDRGLSNGGRTDATAATTPTPLRRLLATAAGLQAAALSHDATLGGDIGLDSLSRVELLAAIEDGLGVYLDESRVGPDTTVAELERMLSDLEGDDQSAVRPVFPSWPRSMLARATRGAAQIPTFALMRSVVDVDVSGRERLDGLTTPVLFVANHTSHLDTPTVLHAMPASWRRRIAVAAAADYFFTRPVVSAGVGLLLNAFPFSRTSAIRPTLEHCGFLFDEGWSILLYPEGTRSTNGSIAPFKTGVGLIARDLGVPVVPIALSGLGSVLPKGRAVPRRGHATIAFGPPLTFEKGTSYAAATATIEAAVRRLLVDR